jgi:hypothetical protein
LKVKTADANETDVGAVYKVFSGYLQEFYTNADNFLIQSMIKVPRRKNSILTLF